jgi:hypothetical protein
MVSRVSSSGLRKLRHTRRLEPVTLEGLEHELDARRERDEAIGPGSDRMLLEALLADLLDVFLGHDPAGAGGRRAVEGHEVGPGLLEAKTDPLGIDHVDAGDPRLEGAGARPPIALERELHVLGRHRITVVEARSLAQDELVHEAIGRDGPRLGQAGSHGVARHRFHERVVHRIEEQEGRDDPHGLGRVEPRRRERDVDGGGQLAFRSGHGGGPGTEGEQQDGDRGPHVHRRSSSASRFRSSERTMSGR